MTFRSWKVASFCFCRRMRFTMRGLMLAGVCLLLLGGLGCDAAFGCVLSPPCSARALSVPVSSP